MAYSRSEDQYKIPKAREMIKELSEKDKCKFSTIKIYKHIKFNNAKHAGTLSHVCSLDLGHDGYCKCLCGLEWKGWS